MHTISASHLFLRLTISSKWVHVLMGMMRACHQYFSQFPTCFPTTSLKRGPDPMSGNRNMTSKAPATGGVNLRNSIFIFFKRTLNTNYLKSLIQKFTYAILDVNQNRVLSGRSFRIRSNANTNVEFWYILTKQHWRIYFFYR